MKIEVEYVLFAAVAVLGVEEWIKNVVAAVKGFKAKPDALVWVLLSPVLSLLVALLADGGRAQVYTNAVMILAANELLGYNVIVKILKAFVQKIVGVSVDLEGPK